MYTIPQIILKCSHRGEFFYPSHVLEIKKSELREKPIREGINRARITFVSAQYQNSQGTNLSLMYKHSELLFFSKRGEKKELICRAAVKPGGRSPESKR